MSQSGKERQQRGSTWVLFLVACGNSPQLQEQAEKDFLELWEHAQGEFIAALLMRTSQPGAPWDLKNQERALLQMLYRFYDLRYAYQKWRMGNLSGNVRKDFLPQQPPFTLSLRGRPQESKLVWPWEDPACVYSNVLFQLKYVLWKKQSEAAGDKKFLQRKQAIREAVLKSFSVFQDPPGQLHPDLEERLESWKTMSRQDIAYELAAWTDTTKRKMWASPEQWEKVLVAVKRQIDRKKQARKAISKEDPFAESVFFASRHWLPIERTIREKYERLHRLCFPSLQFPRHNPYRNFFGDDVAAAHKSVEEWSSDRWDRVLMHTMINEAYDREKENSD